MKESMDTGIKLKVQSHCEGDVLTDELPSKRKKKRTEGMIVQVPCGYMDVMRNRTNILFIKCEVV